MSMIVFNSNALRDESLNDITITLATDYDIDITKQGLNGRFNAYAVKFLTAALESLLNKQLSQKISFRQCIDFKRLLVKDSVCFQIDESLAHAYPGSGGDGSKANVRIQFEYDILNGKIVDLSINAFNDQDSTNSTLTLDVVESGDLIVRDLAYMHLEVFKGIINRLGHFLCRLKTQAKVYTKKNGKITELDFFAIVKYMRKNNIQQIEETVCIGKNKDFQVRLFMYLLPVDIYNNRIRKAQKEARKKGSELTDKYKARAALNLFITSASEELISIEAAWQIYTLRWQIELTFKIWKSLCKIDKVKKVKKDRLECYILAKLLIIVLCWRVVWLTGMLLKQYYSKNISCFKAFKTLTHDVATLKKIFIDRTLPVGEYLIAFLKLSSKKHLLEKRKGGNYSPEILYRSLNLQECWN